MRVPSGTLSLFSNGPAMTSRSAVTMATRRSSLEQTDSVREEKAGGADGLEIRWFLRREEPQLEGFQTSSYQPKWKIAWLDGLGGGHASCHVSPLPVRASADWLMAPRPRSPSCRSCSAAAAVWISSVSGNGKIHLKERAGREEEPAAALRAEVWAPSRLEDESFPSGSPWKRSHPAAAAEPQSLVSSLG